MSEEPENKPTDENKESEIAENSSSLKMADDPEDQLMHEYSPNQVESMPLGMNTSGSLFGITADPEEAKKLDEIQSKASTVFVFSLISVCFCTIPGIVASVYANKAKKAANGGNLLEAENAYNTAIFWMAFSFIVGGLILFGRLAGG